ncbi:hypothetical protein ABZ621_31335 [Streptomyces sp. NPDC007863]|uniref:hypothetical protein n=1 Tax=Streptomyces sp. NPDC007863 TaxID=3154894 RepID=UPI0033D4D5BE
MGVHAVCRRLNVRELPSKRGGKWQPTTVARIIDGAARETTSPFHLRQGAEEGGDPPHPRVEDPRFHRPTSRARGAQVTAYETSWVGGIGLHPRPPAVLRLSRQGKHRTVLPPCAPALRLVAIDKPSASLIG